MTSGFQQNITTYTTVGYFGTCLSKEINFPCDLPNPLRKFLDEFAAHEWIFQNNYVFDIQTIIFEK